MVTNGSTSYPQVRLSWDYDRYGNRKAQNGTNSMQLTISTTTNRVTQIGSIGTEHDLAVYTCTGASLLFKTLWLATRNPVHSCLRFPAPLCMTIDIPQICTVSAHIDPLLCTSGLYCLARFPTFSQRSSQQQGICPQGILAGFVVVLWERLRLR